ncbi:MAG: sulfatase-like hydrolase/transferase [Candidatus Acidiferrales bacterium]
MSIPVRILRSAFFLFNRLLCCAFLVLTSTYCILAYTPFAYFGFLHPPLMHWVGEFARVFGSLYCAVFLVLGSDWALDFRKSKIKSSLAGFLLLNLGFGVYQIFHHDLAGLTPNVFAFVWAMLSLFPLVWLGAIDISGLDRETFWGTPENKSYAGITLCLFSAFLVVIAFGAMSIFRAYRFGGQLPLSDVPLAFALSMAIHFLIFGVFGGAMQLFRAVSRRTPWPRQAGHLLPRMFICGLGAAALRELVLPSISFEGLEADIFCAVVSVVLTFYATAVLAKLREINAGSEIIFPRRAHSKWLLAPAAAALCACAYYIPVILGPTDWDFVVQKLSVLAVWAGVIGFVRWIGLRAVNTSPRIWAAVGLIVALAGFAPYKLQSVAPDWSDISDTYAGWDISFKTASAVLTESVRSDTHFAFYEFLKRNSNLRQPIGPANLSLVSDLKRTADNKPDIFVFVIDSLRQDYVSSYNPSVDFTPEIGKFAQDSVVFQNAFTRYGGTAIAEPSIWSGVMLPHKQFVQPFYPVNNLQQLLDAEGYQSYISVDPILQQILRMSPSITQLDEGTRMMSDYEYDVMVKGEDPRKLVRTKQDVKSWSNLDLVDTLSELESKIDARGNSKKPFFVYTQPQNVHTVTLEESNMSGGRREITIHEMRRIDAAFGKFIQFLQARGLYDNSIIILTADHGDAYGEFGRFGHSDFLFPPVIRIPLIIHLPPSMQKQFVWDTRKIAFSLDITPSLYCLLGQRPTLHSELAGRPLFTRTLAEQDSYLRPQYLIASSYAPVYGILGDNGETLFIADGVNQRNYFYDLSSDPQGVHNLVTSKIRDANETLIRSDILSIDEAYGVKH